MLEFQLNSYLTEEWETYHLTISQWEVDRYSHMF